MAQPRGSANDDPEHGASAAGAHTVEALLLNCIDYRLIEGVAGFMHRQGLTRRYDQVILAGGALGAVTDRYPAWNTTFWQHLELALQLHGISRVIVIDHRDCGAYRLIFDHDFAREPETETRVHGEQMRRLRAAITDKYPELSVELYLMALDGSAEAIG